MTVRKTTSETENTDNSTPQDAQKNEIKSRKLLFFFAAILLIALSIFVYLGIFKADAPKTETNPSVYAYISELESLKFRMAEFEAKITKLEARSSIASSITPNTDSKYDEIKQLIDLNSQRDRSVLLYLTLIDLKEKIRSGTPFSMEAELIKSYNYHDNQHLAFELIERHKDDGIPSLIQLKSDFKELSKQPATEPQGQAWYQKFIGKFIQVTDNRSGPNLKNLDVILQKIDDGEIHEAIEYVSNQSGYPQDVVQPWLGLAQKYIIGLQLFEQIDLWCKTLMKQILRNKND
jgi:hypothetical protein